MKCLWTVVSLSSAKVFVECVPRHIPSIVFHNVTYYVGTLSKSSSFFNYNDGINLIICIYYFSSDIQ